jgi:hypothetical protein
MKIENGRYIMGVDLGKGADMLVLVPMRRNTPIFQQAIAISNDEFGELMHARKKSRDAGPPPAKND